MTDLEITWFNYGNEIYIFKTPIPLTMVIDGGYFFTHNEEFDIDGIGYSLTSSINDARNEILQRYEWKFDTEHFMLQETKDWLEKIDKNIDWDKSYTIK